MTTFWKNLRNVIKSSNLCPYVSIEKFYCANFLKKRQKNDSIHFLSLKQKIQHFGQYICMIKHPIIWSLSFCQILVKIWKVKKSLLSAEISLYRKNNFFCEIKKSVRFQFRNCFFAFIFKYNYNMIDCIVYPHFVGISFLVVCRNFCISKLRMNKCWKNHHIESLAKIDVSRPPSGDFSK